MRSALPVVATLLAGAVGVVVGQVGRDTTPPDLGAAVVVGLTEPFAAAIPTGGLPANHSDASPWSRLPATMSLPRPTVVAPWPRLASGALAPEPTPAPTPLASADGSTRTAAPTSDGRDGVGTDDQHADGHDTDQSSWQRPPGRHRSQRGR